MWPIEADLSLNRKVGLLGDDSVNAGSVGDTGGEENIVRDSELATDCIEIGSGRPFQVGGNEVTNLPSGEIERAMDAAEGFVAPSILEPLKMQRYGEKLFCTLLFYRVDIL